MRVRNGFEGLCYVGTDPANQGGTIRIVLGDMSIEQLRGWLRNDYTTASKYVEEIEPLPEIEPDKVDNQPGAPLPKKPQYEAETNAKKTGNTKSSSK